jgi:tetratricopeptide (TPR) repeat protein
MTPRCKKAFDLVYSLQIDSARKTIANARDTDPGNLAYILIDDYADMVELLVSEDEVLYKNSAEKQEQRIAAIIDDGSFWPVYVQAEIYLHWSINKARFGDLLSAGMDLNRAYRLLEKLKKKYPEQYIVNKSLGPLHAALGTIPDEYAWLLQMLGFKGTIPQGIGELRLFISKAESDTVISAFRKEGLLFMTALVQHLAADDNKLSSMIKLLSAQKPKENPIVAYFYTSACMRLGRNEEALDILLENHFAEDAIPFPFLDYQCGLCLLNKMQFPAAQHYFGRFLKTHKGKSYRKATYQKLAWISLLNQQPEQYAKYMEFLRMASNSLSDEDKQAEAEAARKEIPNTTLLKARLLFDGGYYKEALTAITSEPMSSVCRNKDEQAEYSYRTARIFDRLNMEDKALLSYNLTLSMAQGMRHYYAASAALHMALIYENREDYAKAKELFNQCLSMKGHTYKSSLDQKARAGLQRISVH